MSRPKKTYGGMISMKFNIVKGLRTTAEGLFLVFGLLAFSIIICWPLLFLENPVVFIIWLVFLGIIGNGFVGHN